MTITNIDASNIKTLRDKLQAKLDEFANENGLTIGSFTIKYMADSFTINKLVIGVATPGEPKVDPRFKKDLERRGWNHGLTTEMIGKIVVLPTRAGLTKCKFLGMAASKAVFEIDGRVATYPADAAAKYLKA